MKDTVNEFKLKNRNNNGNTPILNYWGASSEYGVLKDVLIGPVENYRWLKTSSVSKKTIRRKNEFKPEIAKKQYQEMKKCQTPRAQREQKVDFSNRQILDSSS